jgi:D-alanyl-D-alanine-carboxypeptidase/D-alanyl-D-alanine-endopeptidase
VALTLAEDVLERYTGVYEFTPQVSLTVTRDRTRIFGQVTGQPQFEIFAEAEHKFFVRVVNAQITFEPDANGAVTSLVLHQNGANQKARKGR